MKLRCLQENLLPALSGISRAAAGKSTLPVLSNTLLTTYTGKILLSATNLEYSVSCNVPADVEEQGSLTIPAKLFHEFIASLPPGEVILSSDEASFTCTEKRFKANLVGIPASEFPPLPEFPKESFLNVPTGAFIGAVQQVFFAASTDEGRQALTGVLVDIRPTETVVVATDGYRLSRAVIEGLNGTAGWKIIVPARSLTEAVRLFIDHKDGEMRIAFVDNQLLLSGENVLFSSRTIDAQFPNYEKIIPTEFTTRVVVDHAELLKGVKTAAVFARDSANIIKVGVRPGESEPLYLSSQTAQVGDEMGHIEASVEGEGLEIAFNGRYILDVINAIKQTQVSIELSGSLSPGLFRPVGDTKAIHIIMPVRTQTT